MDINYEYYRIFYYVAKYKNITQAAKAIMSNQPNVSRTMRLLEHELGCNLIIRSNRGISLTPEGERLYSHIKIAVEQIQTAEEEITMSTAMNKGIVTIGTSEIALHMILLPVLNTFKKKYPQINIRLSNNFTRQAVEAAKNGIVDFAIVVSPAYTEKPLVKSHIMDFKDIVIGGPSLSFMENKTISLKELNEYPLVFLGENTVTYKFYSEYYMKNNLELKPDFEAASTDQIIPLIKNDLGIAFIPELLARDALEKKEICRINIKEKLPKREICFIENENYPLSIAAKELKKCLFELL